VLVIVLQELPDRWLTVKITERIQTDRPSRIEIPVTETPDRIFISGVICKKKKKKRAAERKK
jgi:hypothetical protein